MKSSAPPRAADAPVPTVPRGRRRLWRWVPIRRLHERHRARILKHLLDLGARDRYLRFGYPASDERIARFVDMIDFERNVLFGIFNRRLQLVGLSQLALLQSGDPGTDGQPAGTPAEPMIEFAVSVSEHARGRGYGDRLFSHAVLHARNAGIHRLMIHALSENTAMLRIARKAGSKVMRDGGEAEAWLELPPYSVVSQIEELVADRASELNYGIKHHTRWVDRWLMLVQDVRRRYASRREVASH